MNSSKEENATVKIWMSRLADSTAHVYVYYFKDWLRWMGENGGEFAGMVPDELVKHQRETTKQTEYRMLDLAQAWVLGKNGQRKGTKENMLKAVKSFFEHNRAGLPRDKSFKLRSEKGIVPNLLTVEEIRRVVLASNKTLRAAFMVMLCGGLDQESVVHWSDNGWVDLTKQLRDKKEVVKITIPGRKATRNEAEFSTYIMGDAINCVKDYIKERGDGDGPIFVNQFKQAVTKSALSDYWIRKLKELGIISRSGLNVERYGRGLHNLRDTFRTLWAQSGAAPHVAEAMMGHMAKVDPLGYDRSFENEAYVNEQLEQAAPFLNVLTRGEAYGQIDKNEVKRLKKEIEEAKAGQSSEIAELKRQQAATEAKLDKAIKALMEIYEREKPKTIGP